MLRRPGRAGAGEEAVGLAAGLEAGHEDADQHALRRRRSTSAGFVHVPWLPEQAAAHAQPGMPREQTTRALEIIVQTALGVGSDARVAAGAIA